MPSPAFLAASLLLALTPGPGVIYIVSRTVARGRAAGLASVAGVACGNAVAAALGLATLFAVWSGAFLVVKLAGAAYLVLLGWRTWRSAGVDDGTAATPASLVPSLPLGRLWRDGLVVALLNPKTTLFFAAFLPQFMDAGAPLLGQAVVLGGIFVAVAAATDAGYAVLAATIAPVLLGRGKAVGRIGRRASGASLIALGVLSAAAPVPAGRAGP